MKLHCLQSASDAGFPKNANFSKLIVGLAGPGIEAHVLSINSKYNNSFALTVDIILLVKTGDFRLPYSYFLLLLLVFGVLFDIIQVFLTE
jgi:hypothetical protein